MSHTNRLRNAPKAFRQPTGITPAAFDRLLDQLTPRYEQAEARRKNRPGRKRKPGAGRKHTLLLADRLLMLFDLLPNLRLSCVPRLPLRHR